MALIKCPECGKEISDKANTCPSCGYPIQQEIIANKPKPSIIPILILVICPFWTVMAYGYMTGILLWNSFLSAVLCGGLAGLILGIDRTVVKKAGYTLEKKVERLDFIIPYYIYKRMELVHGYKWLYTILWFAVLGFMLYWYFFGIF